MLLLLLWSQMVQKITLSIWNETNTVIRRGDCSPSAAKCNDSFARTKYGRMSASLAFVRHEISRALEPTWKKKWNDHWVEWHDMQESIALITLMWGNQNNNRGTYIFDRNSDDMAEATAEKSHQWKQYQSSWATKVGTNRIGILKNKTTTTTTKV